MIKTINEDLLDSEANFIVNLVDDSGNMNFRLSKQVKDKYPHVDTQYRKYIAYCEKHKIDILGRCQYVPADSWAIGLVDTMKNNDLYNYDEPYQYIVNCFVGKIEKRKLRIDKDALYTVLKNIRNKTRFFKTISIAIPYGIDFVGDYATWESGWKIVEEAIYKTFTGNREVNVLICKKNYG